MTSAEVTLARSFRTPEMDIGVATSGADRGAKTPVLSCVSLACDSVTESLREECLKLVKQ